MRIELTQSVLKPRLSDFLRNSTIHFRIFLYLVTCFLRVTVSLLCRSQAVSKLSVPIYHYQISEGRRNCQSFDRYINETVTLRKHVTKYKNMRKQMVEILRKSNSSGNKNDQVNSIRITKSINLLYFCTLLRSVVMLIFLN